MKTKLWTEEGMKLLSNRANSIKMKFVALTLQGKLQRRRRRAAKPYAEGINSCTPASPTDGTGKVEIIHLPDDPTENIEVHYHGGALIPHVSLQLIFWGNAWTQPPTTPTSGQVIAAVQSILAGPYMSRLLQYGIGVGNLRGAITVLSDPPNPFSKDDWHNLIWDLIDQGTFPEPDEPDGRNLYVIIPPPGVGFTDSGTCGAHGFPGDYDFPADYDVAWGGFVLNDGNLDTITTSLSHELVEACTDPEDDGWTIKGRSSPSAEICDVCEQTTGRVNGVMVQGYWSVHHNACIIPLAPPQNRWQISCINKTPRTDRFHSIKEVGGTDANGLPFRFARDGVIGMIKQGHSFFVVGPDGSTSEVGVFIHFPPGHEVEGLEFIATSPDQSKQDNLLSLPECA